MLGTKFIGNHFFTVKPVLNMCSIDQLSRLVLNIPIGLTIAFSSGNHIIETPQCIEKVLVLPA